MFRPTTLFTPAFVGGLMALAVAACVTINVYFPEAAAERAADRIIEEVWGPGQTAPGGDGDGSNDQTRYLPPAKDGARFAQQERNAPSAHVAGVAREPSRPLALTLLELLVPAAHAQSDADLDIDTPEVNALTRSMNRRFSELKPLFDAGAIGLTRDGLIEIRDRGAVPLNQRSQLSSLVSAENQDRNALYAAIARANGHPEWEDDIRRTFAQRWISRASQGWYYRTSGGAWTRK